MNVNMQPTFGGFNLDDVLKNEEAKKKSQESHKPAPVNAPGALYHASYHDLEFQPEAYGAGKTTFNSGVGWIHDAEYTRYPFPREVMDLLIARAENVPLGALDQVAKEMAHGPAEWVDIVLMREKDTLHVYISPDNITLKGSGVGRYYVADSLDFKESFSFRIPESNQHEGIQPLGSLPPDIVKFFYGRTVEELPISTTHYEWGVELPPSDGRIYPVMRESCMFYIYKSVAASRGVRVKQ